MNNSNLIEENNNENLYLIFINSPKNNPSEKNKISTSKYQWNTFFPKMLMEQFSRLANVYFLIIAILQSIREVSYSGGYPIILFPLAFVIVLNGTKDLYEDFKRKKSDTEENNKISHVYNKEQNTFIEKKWKDIKLGEIVKVNINEPFPADLLLLNSSDPKGICYIETKNIDGETNLKYRQVNNEIKNILQNNNDFLNFNYVCVTKQPNEYIYQFSATLYEYEGNNLKDKDKYILIDEKSFLLRGSTLKQTDYIIGSVIYVGENTKSMLNSPNTRSKHSSVEYIMNFQILTIFSLQILISMLSSIIHLIFHHSNSNNLDYIFIKNSKNKEPTSFSIFLKLSGTWILIFTNFVPISLLVTMETIKFFQAMFISWDIEMFDVERDLGTKVHSSTLNEELGQVKFIFSDKTGTLTKNYMQYKCMSIGEKMYGDMTINQREKKNEIKDNYGYITNVEFSDLNNEFSIDLNNNNMNIYHFMICLCLCNSVIIDNKKYENENKIEYQASSPDEKALINFARSQEYIFLNRTIENEISLEIKGIKKTYKILNELEYSSERKRMSIICKDPDTNKIILYTKGADSMIELLLDQKSKNSKTFIKTREYLKKFAVKGLRTLMLAYKEISKEEYDNWLIEYLKAKQDISEKETIIPKLYDKIEVNLNLLGSTAIEDELQDEVDSVIHSLMETGIKVWMLTGDKLDTAKNIAYSCKLFEDNMHIIEFNSEENIKTDLISFTSDSLFKKKDIKYGLLISSEILSIIFGDYYLLELFYKLCNRCLSVVCSRVSPKQKAEMVNLIKTSNKAITLAIGDGANDVGMINEANIGIGIYGLEGTQAARASDYAITQFSHLRKLLFFHGREAYRKNTYVVCYNFYKNILFVFPMFFMGFLNIFSGLTIYDPFIHQCFNTFYTAVPIVWFGVYDIEFQPNILISNPKFYIQGIYGKLFHTKRFWKWVFVGIIQGFFSFLISYFTFKNIDSYGLTYDYWILGENIYTIIVIVTNLKIIVDSNTHTTFSIIFIISSIILYYLTVLILSYIERFEFFRGTYIAITGHWSNVMFDLKYMTSSFVAILFSLTFDVFLRKFLILYNFVVEGHNLPPYFDESVFEDNKKKKKISNKNYNDYNEQLVDYN